MKRTATLVLAAVWLGSVPLSAQGIFNQGVNMKKVGQSTMNFLQVGVVPRAVALGEAYSAIGKGPEAIFYNPAGLAEMQGTFGAFVSATRWIADIQYLNGSLAWKFGNVGTVGLSFLTVDYGDIIGTSLLSKSDAAANPLGYMDNGVMGNVGAYAFGLSFARPISSIFLIGGNIRYAGQQLGQNITTETNGKLETNEAHKLSFDMGVKYYTGFKSFNFGMSIRNFSTAVKYEEITAQLPMVFAVGAAMDMLDWFFADHKDHTALLAVEFTHPNNYNERLHLGLEYSFMNMLSLQGGYVTNSDLAGASFGVGFQKNIMGKRLEIGYAYSLYDVFNDINRLSIGFSF